MRLLPMLLTLGLLATVSAGDAALADALTQGKFGKGVALKDGRKLLLPIGSAMKRLPVTYELWFKLDSAADYNILLSQAPKYGPHWELFSAPGSGGLYLWIPQISTTDNIGGTESVTDGKWHYTAVRFMPGRVELYLDGKLAARRDSKEPLRFGESPLFMGGIAGEVLACDGTVDELHISRRTDRLEGYVPTGPAAVRTTSLHILHFEISGKGAIPEDMPRSKISAQIVDKHTRPVGGRFLDEIQDEQFAGSTLHGDDRVEAESRLPAVEVKAKPCKAALGAAKPSVISLSGEWLMKGSEPSIRGQEAMKGGVTGGWWKEDFDRSDWLKVEVPTSVQSALIKLGKLEDPNWNTNTYDELHEHGEPKSKFWANRFTRIEQQEWWFARRFTLPASWRGKPIRLYFDGIDYAGSVYVNGVPLGYHEGMFGGPTLDVTDIVRFGEPNEVVVRVERVRESWNGILKGSPGWGWHYGHLVSLGIWRDVTIRAVPSVEVLSPYVVTRSFTDKKAVLAIEYYIHNHQKAPAKLEIVGSIRGKNFESKPFAFSNEVVAQPGLSRYRTEVAVPDPRLWWPMNYGEQNLYRLTMTARERRDERRAAVDTNETVFGIRTIEMVPAAGAMPESDHKWQFVINGRPMFIKGANWCWSDPMLECDPAKYEKILELARRGGIQMFRAWGGGIIETDTFYEKCDEKGLMVYQEFPFCWGPPDFPGTNPVMVDQQVSQVVKRLRNHPSLIMWGGGNENVSPNGGDEGLFLVGRRCRQYDPSRPFHRTDPWGGSAHNWSVFHSGQPMDESYYSFDSVFYGEYGIPSMTNVSSCLKYLPESELDKWPIDETRHGLLMHMNQFNVRDPVKVLRYCDYGPVNSWRTYIEYSQMAQGDWLRFAAEGQRSRSGMDKTGFWFYKFTDLFPGHSWAVVDYYGSPKLSYYRAKQTCLPRCAFATYRKLEWADEEPFEAVIHAANDTSSKFDGAKVRVVVYGSDLKPAWAKDYAVKALGPDERADLDRISVKLPAAKNKPFLLAVSMRDAAGKLVSDQWYWLNFKSKTDPIKDLEKLNAWDYPEGRCAEAFEAYGEIPEARLLDLPRTKLAVSAALKGRKGHLSVKNTGDLPAFNVLIDNFPDGYEDYLDDNSFFLLPGEERRIGFQLGDRSSIEQVSIRAWNADPVKAAL